MSPVFGGGTANAEFEVLCGIPIIDAGVTFLRGMKNEELPCLPTLLKRLKPRRKKQNVNFLNVKMIRIYLIISTYGNNVS